MVAHIRLYICYQYYTYYKNIFLFCDLQLASDFVFNYINMAFNYKFDKFCSIINHKDNNYVLRTRLQTDCYSTSSDEWVSMFSEETKTNWIANKTFPYQDVREVGPPTLA